MIAMIWLSLIDPNVTYTESAAYQIYDDNATAVNAVLDDASDMNSATNYYYSNRYDVPVSNMTGNWDKWERIENGGGGGTVDIPGLPQEEELEPIGQ
jgi:hypothetical protein